MESPSPESHNLFLAATGEEHLTSMRRYLTDIFAKVSPPRRRAMLEWAQRYRSAPHAIPHVRMFVTILRQKNIDLSKTVEWQSLVDMFIDSQKRNIDEAALARCRTDITTYLSSWFDVDKAASARPGPSPAPVSASSRLKS